MRSSLIAAILALLAAASPAQDLRQQQRRDEALRHYRAGEEFMLAEAFEEAADEFKKATEKDPVFARAFYGLGRARMALRQGEAHNNLAVIYMLSGRLDEAERAMKAAEKAGFPVSSQFKQDLKQRMSTKKP